MYEGKPVDRPVGQPPKKKSLGDVTEAKGQRVVTPNPSNCSRTDKSGHWPEFRNKKTKCRFCKRALFVRLVWNAQFLCVSPVKETAFTNLTAIDYPTEK